MPKRKGYGKKGEKGIMEKGPGDAKGDVKVPSWRGESGDSSSNPSKETDCVHYDR